ncbi:L-ribulose-5-phosphate 4-epimerase [Enterococcus sp. AZ194]|uniref:L-fuculose-phosphate aldolase n=1 Tax=Enterococcus sp. AZ194 TaxID=2774629 RepID=UPI003F267B60
MRYKIEREKIVTYGKKMLADQLTTGTGGNISTFLREEQLMLISPSGLNYEETLPEDIVLLDLEGNIVEGRRKPSSEYDLHRIFYQNHPTIGSVVHTHSEYATSVACLNEEIPPIHYLVGLIGEKIRCCKYKTFGTMALAEEAFQVMADNKGILMGNHGVLAVGETLEKAYGTAADIEFLAKLYIHAKSVGTPTLLSKNEIAVVLEKAANYGQNAHS